jgi:uncharacterized protein
MDLAARIAAELGIQAERVASAVALLDEGNTIPFLARYRKEQTGHLDEEQLRAISERAEYLRNLEARRQEVLRSLEEQGVLTPELAAAVLSADTLQRLEDVYRPYRPKRRTRGSVARDQGLEPLAAWLLEQARIAIAASPEAIESFAARFVNAEAGIDSIDTALAGARDIIAEDAADDADVRAHARRHWMATATLVSQAKHEKAEQVFRDYCDYSELVRKMPPHRVLAVNRGEREGMLRVRLEAEAGPVLQFMHVRALGPTAMAGATAVAGAAAAHVRAALEDGYQRLLAPAVERDVRNALTEAAEEQAIKVFAANLRALLLTAPIRGKVVMGVDPAYRTGCKIAVVDATGKLLAVTVVYPTPPQRKVEEAERVLLNLIHQHGVDVIAIGNGTASRETESFIAAMLRKLDGGAGRGGDGQPVRYVIVSEAGASVYSASPLARDEFPELDVAERSAVSIARRLQDPLAELVKIEPKAIGVGQYQHDVAQARLARVLDGVVESAVNSVGVDLNTASAALLTRVAGLTAAVAKNIVTYREENGPFPTRSELAKVSRLGPKTFQQCAGFLRVPGGRRAFDNTAIHPESYGAAAALLAGLGYSDTDVEGPGRAGLFTALAGIKSQPVALADWALRLGVGEPTLSDIIDSLARPGRDPRDELPQPVLRSDVLTIEQLRAGMLLEGTVRNVVDFGAFVDIGVGQDGLVHVSQISDGFIRHPLDKLSVGDIVGVEVLAVDTARGRISLACKPRL